MIPELKRIDLYHNGEIPLNKLYWRFKLSSESDIYQILERVLLEMRIISSYTLEEWPPDSDWAFILSGWLVDSFNEKEQARKGLPGWHFGSWLAAIQSRGWEWWSHGFEGSHCQIVLLLNEYPAGMSTFWYLIAAAGEGVTVTEHATNLPRLVKLHPDISGLAEQRLGNRKQ